MATTSSRRALSSRTLQSSSVPAHKAAQRHSSASFKRPRSPDPAEHSSASQSKKARATTSAVASALQKEREAKKERLEREQQKQEFREKYSKAFPQWTFYFDIENISFKSSQVNILKSRVEMLGGQIEEFFQKDITHLITDKPIPSSDSAKENRPNLRGSKASHALKSPIHLKSRSFEDSSRNNDVVVKATSYGHKIWNATKLDSVLSRCLDSPSVNAVIAKAPSAPTQKLERLLSKEKHHGPSDRDPTQKRHDYRYFSKGSFFVLVEDMRGEVATIAAHEYPAMKDKAKAPWPVLHCHPHARGPFTAFDEKEKQRWERAQQKKLEGENASKPLQKVPQSGRAKTTRAKLTAARGMSDLRRSVSLNNLHKRMAVSPETVDLDGDGDNFNSANASGFLVSGAAYMAASGNSVGVTSTTGTTSTASGLRRGQLPASLEAALKRQIVTSKKVTSTKVEKKIGNMDPPSTVPARQQGMLKRAKSMNTFKLPKREEGSKPGYCECCRQKFDDFKMHVISSKHRRFAQNDDNFLQLDAIISRLQRRSFADVELEEKKRVDRCRLRCSGVLSSGSSDLIFPSDSTP